MLASFVPVPARVLGRAGTAPADGTVRPTWDWKAVPGLYTGKAGYAGMNVQVTAALNGDVAAIGPLPVRGARQDAYAFGASGLKALPEKPRPENDTVADLGYTGVRKIGTVPFKRVSGAGLNGWQRGFNAGLSKVRSAVEHAIAKVKCWRRDHEAAAFLKGGTPAPSCRS